MDFDADILAPLAQNPFFRLAPDGEIDGSWAAYQRGDIAGLIDHWAREVEAQRVNLPERNRKAFARARYASDMINGLMFLVASRAALGAGERFRERLGPRVKEALLRDFPWLENRHTHIPAGWSPPCEFPSPIDKFFADDDVAAAKIRWQLVAALNEVMQYAATLHMAELVQLPVLKKHADRERALALNYFAHEAPPADRALWRQCIIVLDGMNAAVFAAVCDTHLRATLTHVVVGSLARRAEWRSFVAGLDSPQWLLPV